MNRTEWDACKDPLLLLRAMQSQGSDRKFRLLACAFADATAAELAPWTPPQAERIARFEGYADGYGGLPSTPADSLRLPQYDPDASRVRDSLRFLANPQAFIAALDVISVTLGELYRFVIGGFHKTIPAELLRFEPILAAQRHLIHDAFDHRMRLAPLFLGSIGDAPDVQHLARAVYADKSFADMPVLGDALEDAGCDDDEVLDHCRNHPLHARGCWVLDAILGWG